MKKILKSSRETKSFAAFLAEKLIRSKIRKNALIISLIGNLGAGKTTFIQGFAKKFHVKHRVVSPSFLIFRRYSLPKSIYKKSGFRSLYHVDLYRIHKKNELDVLAFKKIMAEPHNIILIEWADKIPAIVRKSSLRLTFAYGAGENERIIIYKFA